MKNIIVELVKFFPKLIVNAMLEAVLIVATITFLIVVLTLMYLK